MYQFFLNAEDSKVIEYLKKLTFLTKKKSKKLKRNISPVQKIEMLIKL